MTSFTVTSWSDVRFPRKISHDAIALGDGGRGATEAPLATDRER
jgi:hypothetical protein